MNQINNNYSFCPSCGKRIYNYEDNCSDCGTKKINIEELKQDESTTVCKNCGCILQNEFNFCPSCGNAYKKRNSGKDYEATNKFLKIMRASRAALLSLFFAIGTIAFLPNVISCVISMVCSLVCIGVQIYINSQRKYKERNFSYIFITITAIILIIIIVVLIAIACELM